MQIASHAFGGPTGFMWLYISCIGFIIKQEKFYTQAQLNMTHINFAILNSQLK